MIFSILGKLAGTDLGLALLLLRPEWPILGFAALGILPIWLEVLATRFTGVEPSLEQRPAWKYADAAVDAFSFLLIPAVCFRTHYHDAATTASLGLFVALGGYRLIRFLRKGLVGGQYFEGLPVTYTGYAWPVCAALGTWGYLSFADGVLAILGVLMVWTRLKIKRTQTRHDAP